MKLKPAPFIKALSIKALSVFMLTLLLGGCFYMHPVAPLQFKALQARAEAGDADAQVKVASMLICGTRCGFGPWRPPCDEAAALKWYKKAAENGNAEAQTAVGYAYSGHEVNFSRLGLGQDLPEEKKWLLKAAAQNYVPAYRALARLAEEEHDETEAAKWSLLTAEEDTSADQAKMADRYATGNGVEKDRAKAIAWALKAAKTGDILYQFKLGQIYADLTPPDYASAYYWISLTRPALAHTSLISPDLYKKWPPDALEKHLTPEQIASVQTRVKSEVARICKEGPDNKKQFYCPEFSRSAPDGSAR